MLGTQSIQLGMNDCVVAGGMESMSNIPHYLQSSRLGLRMGHGQVSCVPHIYGALDIQAPPCCPGHPHMILKSSSASVLCMIKCPATLNQ